MADTPTKPATPELDKMLAVRERAQPIGDFLEWLQAQGYSICKWRDEGDNGEPRRRTATPEELEEIKQNEGWSYYRNAARQGIPNEAYESWGDGFVYEHRNTLAWLELFLGVDGKKCDEERSALLDYVRACNEQPARAD